MAWLIIIHLTLCCPMSQGQTTQRTVVIVAQEVYMYQHFGQIYWTTWLFISKQPSKTLTKNLSKRFKCISISAWAFSFIYFSGFLIPPYFCSYTICQSFRASHLKPSTDSSRSTLVSRTYSWLCTLSICYKSPP